MFGDGIRWPRLIHIITPSMASPLLSRAPQCMSCVRRISGNLRDAVPGAQQIRGKKRLAKVATIKVQLLQNVPGYGRRGTVIPVTAGVMRNIWYPKGMAEYVTSTLAHKLGLKKDDNIEREYSFQSARERKLERQTLREEQEELAQEAREAAEAEAAARLQQAQWEAAQEASSEEPVPKIKLDMISPSETISILEKVLPPNLNFPRTVVTLAAPKKVSPSIAAAAVTSIAEKATASDNTRIYGSVSTSDIAANYKAVLAEDEEGSRVVLSASDIHFVEEMDEKDRVKHLGIFEIEIRVEGASDVVRRTIEVSARD